MDTFERSDFDAALDAAFPKARRTRRELGDGWIDTFRLGLLEVAIAVYNGKAIPRRLGEKRRPPRGSVVAIINGVRTSIDGSVTPLWKKEGFGLDGLKLVLAELRAELLGLAHAIMVTTGRKQKPEAKPVKIPKPTDDLDLGDLIESLLD